MSDANKTAFLFKKQSAFGTLGTGAAFVIVPTSDSLAHTQGFVNSQRIRSDRQIDEAIRNSVGAAGDLNIEWSWGDPYTELLQGALLHSYSPGAEGIWDDETVVQLRDVAGAVSVGSTTTFNSAGFTGTMPAAGDFVKVNGFANAANNGIFRVQSITTTTVITVDATLVVEAGSASKTITISIYEPVAPGVSVNAATAGTFTIGSGTWSTTPAAGDFVYVDGFAAAGNNGVFKVTSASTTVLNVTPAPSASATGATANIVLLPSITQGTTLPYYTIERIFEDAVSAGNDLTDLFDSMAINGVSMTVPVDSPITGAFSFIGKKQSAAGTVATLTATYPHTGTRVYNGIDYVERIVIGGTTVASATAFDWALSNNLRAKNAIGTLGAFDMGTGTVEVTGSLSIYNAGNTEYAKAIADTASDCWISLKDDDGNRYIFDFPTVRYDAPTRAAGGINTDVIQTLPFRAVRDSAENVTFRVAKL